MDINEYNKLREEIINVNSNISANYLNDDEHRVNEYLLNITEEYKSLFDDVPYNCPVLREEKIKTSRLYQFLIDLPKGSDLHVHGTCLLPMHRLIDFICSEEKLYIDINSYKLTLEKSESTYHLKDALDNKIIDYQELFNKWTILGVKHKENRWAYFESLFSYFEVIDYDMDVLYNYFVYAFKYYLSINIYHVEMHLLFDDNFDMCLKSIKSINKAYKDVSAIDDRFSLSIIGSGFKMYDFGIDDFKKRLNNVYELSKIEDNIVGFDLINEEDSSRPLKEYSSYLLDFKQKHPDFNYYLHSGESLDVECNNLVDAYLLGAKRVGHGLNLYHYPDLMNKYIEKEICLEICPISNQALGYAKNLRNHPFIEFIRRGVTIALASDDPVFLENEALVDDFFAMTTCFNLTLQDIKQLCINSIMYSSMKKEDKVELMDNWKKAYKAFINKYKNGI